MKPGPGTLFFLDKIFESVGWERSQTAFLKLGSLSGIPWAVGFLKPWAHFIVLVFGREIDFSLWACLWDTVVFLVDIEAHCGQDHPWAGPSLGR